MFTQAQHSSEMDMACCRISPFGSLTCSEVGPMSLRWPLASSGGLVQSGHSLSQENTDGEHPENAQFALPHLRWQLDALQPPEVQRDQLNRNTCVHIPDDGLRCVIWTTRGFNGSRASPQLSWEKHAYFAPTAKNNDVICLQEIHGKNEFLQNSTIPAIWHIHTNYLNAGGSAICIHNSILPDGAMKTRVITCQGREHIVTTHSGTSVLVAVNVHFEPDLTLRSLRERLRLITPHWPCYPAAIGIITGDCNICEPEEGRFNVWNQNIRDGDALKSALFRSFSPHVLEIAQPDFTRKDCTADGTIRTLSRIDKAFISISMADFHCNSHVFENLGERCSAYCHTETGKSVPPVQTYLELDV